MSIDVVSPLRQRMIEDMTGRQLGPHSHEEPHLQLQAVRCVSHALSGHGHR